MRSVEYDIASTVLVIMAGLLIVYYAMRKILHLMDGDDRESVFWHSWRFISGLMWFIVAAAAAITLYSGMSYNIVVITFTGTEFSSRMLMCLLPLLVAVWAILDDFMETQPVSESEPEPVSK